MNTGIPSVGAVILAGGESRRMGTDKAALTLDGQRFLDRIAGELSGYPERLVSVRRGDCAPTCPGFTAVADWFPSCGPLGGLHAALSVCRSDYLLAVACDMPLFRREAGEFLALFLSPAVDACVPVDRRGRVHPLCAVYGKSALPVLEAQLRAGDYRLTAALDRLRVKYVPLGHSAYGDETVTNVNTRAEYLALLARRSRIPMAAVCGVKNSGKTAVLCGLLPELKHLGIRTAVIKHDGHDFTPDVPGTDSFRLRQAGAEPVAVYSSQRFLLTARRASFYWRAASTRTCPKLRSSAPPCHRRRYRTPPRCWRCAAIRTARQPGSPGWTCRTTPARQSCWQRWCKTLRSAENPRCLCGTGDFCSVLRFLITGSRGCTASPAPGSRRCTPAP